MVNQTTKAKTTAAQMYDPGNLNIRADDGNIGWDVFLAPARSVPRGSNPALKQPLPHQIFKDVTFARSRSCLSRNNSDGLMTA